jgi:hypothetical protein
MTSLKQANHEEARSMLPKSKRDPYNTKALGNTGEALGTRKW